MYLGRIFAFAALIIAALPAWAAELVMVEQKGCTYCTAWDAKIAPIYPKTPEGQFAPLRRMHIKDAPAGLDLTRGVYFTPTFLLIEDNTEIGRIEGYPGEDFFWGLLEMMLKEKTAYQGTS